MATTKTFLLQYAIVIDVPAEPALAAREAELHMRYRIRQAITDIFRTMPEHLGLQTERITRIDDSTRIGRCITCGLWVTDQESPSVLDGLCQGVQVDGQWYCEAHEAAQTKRRKKKG